MKEPESGSSARIPALLDGTDHLRDEQLLRESLPQFGVRQRNSSSASHSMQDVCHDSVYITVRGNVCLQPGLADDVPHVTLRWTNVKECSVGGEHVVDFAGVDDTYILVSHHYNVQVGRGQRCRQPLYRLVRKAQHVPHATVSRTLLHVSELASAPDKTKSDTFMIGESLSGLKERLQRVAWAMVSRVHYDESAGKLIDVPELFPARWIEPDAVIVRPRRHDQDLFRGDALRLNSRLHESIQRYDAISSLQAVRQHAG
jgi:hypothetical protein